LRSRAPGRGRVRVRRRAHRRGDARGVRAGACRGRGRAGGRHGAVRAGVACHDTGLPDAHQRAGRGGAFAVPPADRGDGDRAAAALRRDRGAAVALSLPATWPSRRSSRSMLPVDDTCGILRGAFVTLQDLSPAPTDCGPEERPSSVDAENVEAARRTSVTFYLSETLRNRARA